MTITQTGVFRHGTFGFPIQITLSATPFSLAGATAINVAIKRPRELNYSISRDLTLPGAIIDAPNCQIEMIAQDGDLPRSGTYNLTITTEFGPSQRLIVDGTMEVS